MSKFQVGDKAIVTDGSDLSIGTEGSKVTISGLVEDHEIRDGNYDVRIEGTDNYQFIFGDQLKPYTGTDKATPTFAATVRYLGDEFKTYNNLTDFTFGDESIMFHRNDGSWVYIPLRGVDAIEYTKEDA